MLKAAGRTLTATVGLFAKKVEEMDTLLQRLTEKKKADQDAKKSAGEKSGASEGEGAGGSTSKGAAADMIEDVAKEAATQLHAELDEVEQAIAELDEIEKNRETEMKDVDEHLGHKQTELDCLEEQIALKNAALKKLREGLFDKEKSRHDDEDSEAGIAVKSSPTKAGGVPGERIVDAGDSRSSPATSPVGDEHVLGRTGPVAGGETSEGAAKTPRLKSVAEDRLQNKNPEATGVFLPGVGRVLNPRDHLVYDHIEDQSKVDHYGVGHVVIRPDVGKIRRQQKERLREKLMVEEEDAAHQRVDHAEGEHQKAAQGRGGSLVQEGGSSDEDGSDDDEDGAEAFASLLVGDVLSKEAGEGEDARLGPQDVDLGPLGKPIVEDHEQDTVSLKPDDFKVFSPEQIKKEREGYREEVVDLLAEHFVLAGAEDATGGTMSTSPLRELMKRAREEAARKKEIARTRWKKVWAAITIGPVLTRLVREQREKQQALERQKAERRRATRLEAEAVKRRRSGVVSEEPPTSSKGSSSSSSSAGSSSRSAAAAEGALMGSLFPGAGEDSADSSAASAEADPLAAAEGFVLESLFRPGKLEDGPSSGTSSSAEEAVMASLFPASDMEDDEAGAPADQHAEEDHTTKKKEPKRRGKASGRKAMIPRTSSDSSEQEGSDGAGAAAIRLVDDLLDDVGVQEGAEGDEGSSKEGEDNHEAEEEERQRLKAEKKQRKAEKKLERKKAEKEARQASVETGGQQQDQQTAAAAPADASTSALRSDAELLQGLEIRDATEAFRDRLGADGTVDEVPEWMKEAQSFFQPQQSVAVVEEVEEEPSVFPDPADAELIARKEVFVGVGGGVQNVEVEVEDLEFQRAAQLGMDPRAEGIVKYGTTSAGVFSAGVGDDHARAPAVSGAAAIALAALDQGAPVPPAVPKKRKKLFDFEMGDALDAEETAALEAELQKHRDKTGGFFLPGEKEDLEVAQKSHAEAERLARERQEAERRFRENEVAKDLEKVRRKEIRERERERERAEREAREKAKAEERRWAGSGHFVKRTFAEDAELRRDEEERGEDDRLSEGEGLGGMDATEMARLRDIGAVVSEGGSTSSAHPRSSRRSSVEGVVELVHKKRYRMGDSPISGTEEEEGGGEEGALAGFRTVTRHDHDRAAGEKERAEEGEDDDDEEHHLHPPEEGEGSRADDEEHHHDPPEREVEGSSKTSSSSAQERPASSSSSGSWKNEPDPFKREQKKTARLAGKMLLLAVADEDARPDRRQWGPFSASSAISSSSSGSGYATAVEEDQLPEQITPAPLSTLPSPDPADSSFQPEISAIVAFLPVRQSPLEPEIKEALQRVHDFITGNARHLESSAIMSDLLGQGMSKQEKKEHQKLLQQNGAFRDLKDLDKPFRDQLRGNLDKQQKKCRELLHSVLALLACSVVPPGALDVPSGAGAAGEDGPRAADAPAGDADDTVAATSAYNAALADLQKQLGRNDPTPVLPLLRKMATDAPPLAQELTEQTARLKKQSNALDKRIESRRGWLKRVQKERGAAETLLYGVKAASSGSGSFHGTSDDGSA